MMNNDAARLLDWMLKEKAFGGVDRGMSFGDWREAYFQTIEDWPIPVDRAAVGGMMAVRVSYAFVAAYHAAVACLVPSIPAGALTAICITEEGGAHPRAIQSRLRKESQAGSGWRLAGRKMFITCAREADWFLVAASVGPRKDGRNDIRMVRIPAGAHGITIEPMETVRLVPEISHGRLLLEDVAVNESDFLAGDGYADYIKPFRTIEDVHMCVGISAYLFRIAAAYRWPLGDRARLAGVLTGFRTLALSDPASPAIHICLGGLLDQFRRLVEEMEVHWQQVDSDVRLEWERDRALLEIAGKARERRLETAWSRYLQPVS